MPIGVIRGSSSLASSRSSPVYRTAETLMGKYGEDAERLIYRRGTVRKIPENYRCADLSVPLARVVAMYPDLPRPFKRYQIAPVWRADRPQKGRYREFYQCDADTVGSASMIADAETITITCEILTRLGFTEFVVNLNNRKILKGIGAFAGVSGEPLRGLYRSIDKLERIGLDGVRQELRKNDIPDDTSAPAGPTANRGRKPRDPGRTAPAAGRQPTGLEGIVGWRRSRLPGRGGDHGKELPGQAGDGAQPGLLHGRSEATIQEPKMPSIKRRALRRDDQPVHGSQLPGHRHHRHRRIIDAMEEVNMFPPDVGTTTRRCDGPVRSRPARRHLPGRTCCARAA
jgi:hypothetical protein